MSEPGFEIAAAFVRVTPDAADFAQALDEQIGGLSVSVLVTPDASDFADALADQIGGLTASVVVTPDASDFAAALDEQIGGLSVTVGVTPNPTDLANLGELIEGGAGGLTATANILANTTDMEDAIGENLGAVSVQVVPNMADFGDKVDEDAGGIVVPVTVTPDTSDFADSLGDQVGDLSVKVGVEPDLADFAEATLERAGLGAMPVSIVPDKQSLANFGSAVEEGTGGITVPVSVVPDAASLANLEERIQEGAGDLEVTATIDADIEPALEGLQQLTEAEQAAASSVDMSAATGQMQELQDAEAGAAAGADAVTEQFAAISDAAQSAGASFAFLQDQAPTEIFEALGAAAEDAAAGATDVVQEFAAVQGQFAALAGDLDSLETQFGSVSGGMASASEETASLAGQISALETQFAAVGGEIGEVGDEIGAAGSDFSSASEQVSLLSGMLDDLKGNLASAGSSLTELASSTTAADTGIETLANGSTSLGAAASESAAEVVDAMGNARQSIADVSTALGSVDYSAATAGLEGVAGAGDDVAKAAPAASEAAGGLSGVLEELVGRMSYMAVDPFMWMYGAPMVIEGVTTAIAALGNSTETMISQMAKADDASGYNVAGYQTLSNQLTSTASSYQAMDAANATASENLIKGQGGANLYSNAIMDVSQAQQQAQTEATNLSTNLQTLSSSYGITQQQAAQLAQAAGVSATSLEGSGTAAETALAKVEAYANANNLAASASAEASADLSTFSNTALTASTRVTALDSAFALMAGNMASSQSGILQVDQDFVSLQAQAQVAGTSMTGTSQASLGLQQSFFGLIPAIENTANAMTKQRDSTQQVSSYVQTQVDRLTQLTGGSQQAQQAVSGLQQFEDKLGQSMTTSGQEIEQTANFLQDKFTVQVQSAGDSSTTTKTQIDALTSSILATGTESTDTAAARQQLITDLENSGVQATTAQKLVANYVAELGQIPKSVSTTITETASGTWSISGSASAGTATASNAGSGSNVLTQHASGGLIQGGSRHPRADDIPALLSHGEYVVNAGAVEKYGAGFMDSINAMHFADGGYTGDPAGLGAWAVDQYSNSYSQFTQQLIQAITAAIAAGPGGSTTGKQVNLIFNGTQMPTPEQTQALMTQLSAAVGVA